MQCAMLPNDFDPSCHPSTFYTRAPISDALGYLRYHRHVGLHSARCDLFRGKSGTRRNRGDRPSPGSTQHRGKGAHLIPQCSSRALHP
jgi:hypothetical protein